MSEFGSQENPFRSAENDSPSSEKSAPLKHVKQFVAAWRIPLLAPAATIQPTHFVGFERGNRVEVKVWTRNQKVNRATFDDAYILAYCATRLVRTYDKTLTEIEQVEIDPRKLLQEMGRSAAPEDISEVINALRRLHMTQVWVQNWGLRHITTSEPLLSIQKFEGRYIAILPDSLWDEISAPRTRVVRIKHDNLALNGARALLFGWAKGFVGKKIGDARHITKGEAIKRAGPFGLGKDPWTEIQYAIAANDIPGFDFSVTKPKGYPTIEVRTAKEPNTRPDISPDTFWLSMDDDDVDEPDPFPLEVSI